jgi:hypothetical protein
MQRLPGRTPRAGSTTAPPWLVLTLALGCTARIAGPPDETLAPGATGSGATGSGATGTGATGGDGTGGTAGLGTTGGSSSGGLGSGGSAGVGLDAVATQYFPGQVARGSAPRLSRLTRTQLDLTTQHLLPGHYVETAFESLPRDPLQTNYEYAANLGFSAANFTPFTTWVAELAARVKAAPTSVIDCAAADTACLEREAKAFVTRAFRGVASDATLARFAAFFLSSVTEVGLAQATADLVDVTLASPGYAFREEVQADATGRLLPAELLQNVSYTLADAPPAALGLSLPDAPTLPQAELERAVDRVLATPEARNKLLRFFMSWLEVREPDELDLAPSVFPELTPEVASAMVEETRAFLERQLAKEPPLLRDVTESTQAIVSEPTAFLYGLTGNVAAGPVELDPSQRFGIFTQPAVIASHSGPTTTRLVKRGVFFTRKVMCLDLGTPPEDVDTTLPPLSDGTERQRLESVTTPPKCAGCHAYINPFGFMQESYDAIGRYRTTDNGQPVDTSISVDFLDEGPFSASTPVEALRGFTRSWRFQQCFARQVFRFYMGRDETEGDDPLLRTLFLDFARQESQDLTAMLRTLAGSKSVSDRSEAP